ncbi:Uncharacterised protein [Streptococcus pneumoniae]|nr:Uncharacterised protein [Streptococcus pneumoniae]
MFVPNFSSKGKHLSYISFSPPTIIASFASFAPTSPPETGASNVYIFLLFATSLIRFAKVGVDVVKSIAIVPSFACSIIPSIPKYTSSTSCGYPTIVITISTCFTNSFGVSHQCAPACTKESVFAFVLLYTYTL